MLLGFDHQCPTLWIATITVHVSVSHPRGILNMFDPLKMIRTAGVRRLEQADLAVPKNNIEAWAIASGMTCVSSVANGHYVVAGEIEKKPWTIERKVGSRPFIQGDELTARAALDVMTSPAVIVINRFLKETLEEQAYKIYTESLHTFAEVGLSQEMRWLALFPERPVVHLTQSFQDNFAVLSGDNSDAVHWVSPEVADLIQQCQSEDFSIPFILMLIRGKVYLHRQLTLINDEVPTVNNCVKVFKRACESAIDQFSSDLSGKL